MAELSIFIDESGDSGEITERPAYYLVTMAFHNQSININDNLSNNKPSPNHQFINGSNKLYKNITLNEYIQKFIK